MKKFIKKISILSVIILALSAASVMVAAPSFADNDPIYSGRETEDNPEACPDFLGLTSWDCGVSIKDEESLKAGIWQIAANIAVDITVIAAYLVLGYVIYGGYQYTLSGGDPNKVATGKKTLFQAFIGLAIVLLASAIMNTIRFVLLGSSGSLAANCATSECINPTNMVSQTIQWFIAIMGVVAAIFIVYGGILYITSSGDPGKVKKAKDMILYALIGLAIVALAEIVTAFVTNIISNSTETAFINETTISKETTHYEEIL